MHNATFPKWIVVCCGGVVGLVTFAVVMASHRQRLSEKVALNAFEVASVMAGCSNYFDAHGRWPTSLLECVTQFGGPTNDAWGHAIIFVPLAPDTGFGRIVSYGRDGTPGGDGPDSDVEFRFGK